MLKDQRVQRGRRTHNSCKRASVVVSNFRPPTPKGSSIVCYNSVGLKCFLFGLISVMGKV